MSFDDEHTSPAEKAHAEDAKQRAFFESFSEPAAKNMLNTLFRQVRRGKQELKGVENELVTTKATLDEEQARLDTELSELQLMEEKLRKSALKNDVVAATIKRMKAGKPIEKAAADAMKETVAAASSGASKPSTSSGRRSTRRSAASASTSTASSEEAEDEEAAEEDGTPARSRSKRGAAVAAQASLSSASKRTKKAE